MPFITRKERLALSLMNENLEPSRETTGHDSALILKDYYVKEDDFIR